MLQRYMILIYITGLLGCAIRTGLIFGYRGTFIGTAVGISASFVFYIGALVPAKIIINKLGLGSLTLSAKKTLLSYALAFAIAIVYVGCCFLCIWSTKCFAGF